MGKKTSVMIGLLMINTIILSALAISADDIDQNDERTRTSFRSLLYPFFKRSEENNLLSFLESTIQTTCGTVEKTSTITFGFPNEIDVDNNPQTGVNGNDISIQYFFLPWLTLEPELSIGVILSLRVNRIGEEIKNEEFRFSSSISDGILQLGYQSPQGNSNEIPESMQLSSYVFLKPESNTKGLTLFMSPQYESISEDHDLILFSNYIEEDATSTYEFLFEPASEKQITIESTRQDNTLQYSIAKDVGPPTIVSAKIERVINDELIQTNFTINPLPSDVTFTLSMTPFSQGGGMIEYIAENDYDTSILFESNNIGICKFVKVNRLPKEFFVEWDPAKDDGYYHLDIDAEGTDISLLDDLISPSINLTITGIEDVSFTALWNFSNPGDFTVIKSTSFHVDLDFIIDVWEARIDAEPTAENIKIRWLTGVTGYLVYDTDWSPLQEIDLLIKGSDLGIRTQGEFVKADDFTINWTIWPPVEWNLETTGEIEFSSMIIDLFIEGTWLRLWPW